MTSEPTKISPARTPRLYRPIITTPSTKGDGLDVVVRMPQSGLYMDMENAGEDQLDFSDTDNVFVFGKGIRIDFKAISHVEQDLEKKDGSVVVVADGQRERRYKVPVDLDKIYNTLEKADIYFNRDKTKAGATRIMVLLPSDPIIGGNVPQLPRRDGPKNG